MADIVNLRTQRKRRARLAEAERAAQNRARYGTPSAERQAAADDRARQSRQLDQHSLVSRTRSSHQ